MKSLDVAGYVRVSEDYTVDYVAISPCINVSSATAVYCS